MCNFCVAFLVLWLALAGPLWTHSWVQSCWFSIRYLIKPWMHEWIRQSGWIEWNVNFLWLVQLKLSVQKTKHGVFVDSPVDSFIHRVRWVLDLSIYYITFADAESDEELQEALKNGNVENVIEILDKLDPEYMQVNGTKLLMTACSGGPGPSGPGSMPKSMYAMYS